MKADNLYVMTNESYGNSAYVTALAQFDKDCAELGFDRTGANLPTVAEFMEDNNPAQLSAYLRAQLLEDARGFEIPELEEWLKA